MITQLNNNTSQQINYSLLDAESVPKSVKDIRLETIFSLLYQKEICQDLQLRRYRMIFFFFLDR